ncbi:hypothetical protein H5783_11665 [Klebsiella pneumoniae]|nr:hypothetical protein [Klebsiella pneumoniae]MCB3733761.1 hypothetical protein [Klebsiella pneumoniae]
MKTQKTAVSPGECHRNFLTANGQEFAIAYLADSHFGKLPVSSFEQVVKPVIKWLNENAAPNTCVNIDMTHTALLTGEFSIHMGEFIKD